MTFMRLFVVIWNVLTMASSVGASTFETDVPSFAECSHGMQCVEIKETDSYILVKGTKPSCPSGYYYVLNRVEHYVEPLMVPCTPELKVTLEDTRLKLEIRGETDFVSLN